MHLLHFSWGRKGLSGGVPIEDIDHRTIHQDSSGMKKYAPRSLKASFFLSALKNNPIILRLFVLNERSVTLGDELSAMNRVLEEQIIISLIQLSEKLRFLDTIIRECRDCRQHIITVRFCNKILPSRGFVYSLFHLDYQE